MDQLNVFKLAGAKDENNNKKTTGTARIARMTLEVQVLLFWTRMGSLGNLSNPSRFL